jgi:hypothetical protein
VSTVVHLYDRTFPWFAPSGLIIIHLLGLAPAGWLASPFGLLIERTFPYSATWIATGLIRKLDVVIF